MKVEKTTSKSVFQPVTVQITFETQEEYNMFQNASGWNVTIPRVLNEQGVSVKDAHFLTDVISEIRTQMRSTNEQ